jgi:hypothetical protein
MKRRGIVLGGLLACFVLTGLAVRGDSAPGKEAIYDSPKAVFAAAQAASKKGDVPALLACLTSDSELLLTGELAARVSLLRGLASLDKTGKAQEKLKPVEDVLARHKLTEEAIRKAAGAKAKGEIGKTLRGIGAQVKDRPKFCAEMLSAWEMATPNRRPRPFVGLDLADVKINGDRATGTLVAQVNEKEKREEPIEFARVGGSWKIVLPEPKASPGGGK